MAGVPRRRLGVALLVPPPFDREIDGLRRAVGDSSLGRIPAHVTLVPPVNVREDRMPDTLAVLRRAAASTRPFAARLGPPTTFLPDNPVLYLAVSAGGDETRALRERLFVEPLARPLTWPFVPHVTLADQTSEETILDALAVLSAYSVDVTFVRVHILEEQPGHVWIPIADAPFAAPAVVGRGGLELELAVSERLDDEAARFAEAQWTAYDTITYGEEFAAIERVAITARRRSAVAGFALGSVSGVSAHLSELLVDAAIRGEGVGSQLLAAFVSEAAARGAEQVSLRTESGSDAEKFYAARGWRVVATLPRYRFNRDFVHMLRRT